MESSLLFRFRYLSIYQSFIRLPSSALFGGTLHATAPAIFCQLDFFAGETYAPVASSGLNFCQVQDGQLVVSPVLLGGGS